MQPEDDRGPRIICSGFRRVSRGACRRTVGRSSGSIGVEYGNEPKTWDPTLSSETLSEYITISMFEGLTRQSADGIEPGVAESWDVSDDGLTYTFHLRKSNWSDGTPLTANDFEYTWKRLCDPSVASPSAAGVTDYVVGAAEYLAGTGTADEVMARALDDYTFEVVLKNPAPFFLNRISADIYCPVNKKSVDLGEGWGKTPGDIYL